MYSLLCPFARCCWPCTRQERLATRHPQRLFKSLRLGENDLLTEARQPVVAAALVVQRGIGPFICFDDQSIEQHLFDGTIERSWPDTHPSPRVRCNLLHDTVAMPLAIRQGEQDVENGRREWKHGLWIILS